MSTLSAKKNAFKRHKDVSNNLLLSYYQRGNVQNFKNCSKVAKNNLYRPTNDIAEKDFLDVSERGFIVLDDPMAQSRADKRTANLFTKGSHHRNLSLI